MANIEVFKSDSGTYRWRFVDKNGNAVAARPGRIRVAGFPAKTRKAVEHALDQALEQMASETPKRAKA